MLFVTTGISNCDIEYPVQTNATFVVSGLPSDGTISPGQTLTLDYTGTSIPAVKSPQDFLGVLEHVIVALKYEPTGTCGVEQALAQRSKNCDAIEVWSDRIVSGKPIIVRITLPKNAKPGGTVQVVSAVRSAERRTKIDLATMRVEYATATQSTATLRVAGGGGGGGGGSGGREPIARMLQAQMPIAPRGPVMQATFPGLVDARQSTDPNGGSLTYSWDLNGDGTFGDDPLAAYRDNGGSYPVAAALPAGMAWIERGSAYASNPPYPKVSVRVTNSAGKSATATADIRVMTPGSGLLSFGAASGGNAYSSGNVPPGGTVDAHVWSPINNDNSTMTFGPAWETYACFDTNGDGTYGDAVTNFTDVPYAGGKVPIGPTRSGSPVRFTAPGSPGQHVIRAVIWDPTEGGAFPTSGCATPLLPAPNTHTTTGVTSELAALITVGSAAARQGAAKKYVATSNLRLNQAATPVAGTRDDRGVVRGMVTRGTFTFKTPAAAKKVKRPAGLADLARGTYVARSDNATVSGTETPGKALYTGQSTVLLRGRSGTLACLTSDASIASTIVTMRGGTKNAGRLVFTAVLTQTPFTMPTVEEFIRQQAANTPPTVKPINGKGPISASTGKKARGLNGTCKSLRKYLR